MRLERERIISRVVANSKPFREVPEVREWQKQFDFCEEKKLPDRFKFLVLDGPSKVGKTRYVQGALCAHPMQALILDCGDAVVPALHGNYVWGEHKLIMFDEAHAKMIIRCKKVFQSGINYGTDWEAAPPTASCRQFLPARRQDGDWLEYMDSRAVRHGG